MKKINYQRAIGEVFFIFLGITLAIAFQNWNEQRQQAKLEKTVLEQLSVALQNDLNDVNDNIGTHTRGKNSCQNILKSLDSSEPINGPAILGAFNQAMDNTFLVSDISTYEYLKSVGVHIIREDSLRNQITRLYDVVYEGIYGREKNSIPLGKEVRDHAKKYYSADARFFITRSNINEAKNDDDLKFDLKNLEFTHQLMINKYESSVKPELEKLIQMVNQQLNR